MRAFAAIVSVALVSAGAWAFALGGGGGTEPPPPPSSTVFAGVLLRAGLGADVLAAAGVTGEEVAALVASVESAYSAPTLASLDEAFMAAKRTHDTLRRKVQSGKGTAQDVTSLRAAETALAQATAARDAYLTSLRTAAKANLSAEKGASIERAHANQAWHLPAHYLVKDRSEAGWVALRDALAAKEIAERDPEETFEESAQSVLASIDAEAEIAAAKVAHETHIAAVQTAWNTAAE